MHFYPSRVDIIWCCISLFFASASIVALEIFWRGVRRGAAIPKGKRRVYALHTAWDDVLDELWRLSQHVASFLLGLIAMFVTPIPAHFVPMDAKTFGSITLLVFFYLNLASGVNTLRAVRDFYWKGKYLGHFKNWRSLNPRERADEHDVVYTGGKTGGGDGDLNRR